MTAIQSTPGGRPRAKRPDLDGVGVSKKLDNHEAMVALYFMYYNFGQVHQTLRVAAMEAGLANRV